MRWFVEISPLGKSKGEATTLCVEAPEWQPALQRARALRGDDSPIGGFSIELLDDGYRAVDPSTRLKYVVRRAPDDAALVPASPVAEAAEELPAHELISQRSEDPTPRSPLTYREAAFSVAPSTSEAEIERLLRAKLDGLQAALTAARPGTRFVSLAVFDHVFKQRPERPPVATLLWKDWRGEAAEVHFASHAPPPAPESVKAVKAALEPPAESAKAVKAALEPPAESAKAVKAALEPPAESAKTVKAAEPAIAKPTEAASVPPPESAKAVKAAEPAIADAPKSVRFSGDELISELFEACGDLHFVQDTLAGAEFVLALTLDKLPSQAGLVSLFDMNKREFVVVRQAHASGSALLLRIPERAAVAATAMRSRHAVVIPDASGGEHAKDPRWRALGVEPKSLICAPVELNGRYLGLIELANPLDGEGYSASDGHALTYIGQQFAEFVASHGVVVDPELIQESSPKKGRTR